MAEVAIAGKIGSDPRRGSMWIWNQARARRPHRLTQVRQRHRAPPLFEPAAEMFNATFVGNEFFARRNHVEQRFAREIVKRRAKSTRHDHRRVRRRKRAQRIGERGAIITHRATFAGHPADCLQRARKPRRVGVLDLSEDEFIADRQNGDRGTRDYFVHASPALDAAISAYRALKKRPKSRRNSSALDAPAGQSPASFHLPFK